MTFCACGCGNITRIAETTSRRDGHIKGRHVKFLKGHSGRRALKDRFFDKVEIQKMNKKGCWIWTGSISKNGYGRIQAGNSRGVQYAHRISWELYYDEGIPEDMVIGHHCDTPSCVNPKHLFIGNQKDNLQDAFEKNRLEQWNSCLSDTTASEIYERIHSGESGANLSREFGVSQSTISNIKNLKHHWKNLVK